MHRLSPLTVLRHSLVTPASTMVAINTLSVQMPPACAVMVASDGEKMLIFSSALKIVRVRDQLNKIMLQHDVMSLVGSNLIGIDNHITHMHA